MFKLSRRCRSEETTLRVTRESSGTPRAFPQVKKTSSNMNSILCTASLMKSHDITMGDRYPRNVGFSHQGFV